MAMYVGDGRVERRLRLTATGQEEYDYVMSAAEVIDDHIHYTDTRGGGCALDGVDGDQIMRWLERAGYVVVHPDDVPRATLMDVMILSPCGNERNAAHTEGWNACRDRIFGGA